MDHTRYTVIDGETLLSNRRDRIKVCGIVPKDDCRLSRTSHYKDIQFGILPLLTKRGRKIDWYKHWHNSFTLPFCHQSISGTHFYHSLDPNEFGNFLCYVMFCSMYLARFCAMNIM